MSLQSLNTKLGLVLPAFVVSLILAGCGGGDGDPLFLTDRPDNLPVVSFLGSTASENGQVRVPLGGASTQLALQLENPAPTAIDVRLFYEGSRATTSGSFEAVIDGAFIAPDSVRIGSNQSFATFRVSTTSVARRDDTLKITIIPGPGYSVTDEEGGRERTLIAGPALGSMSLVGPDLAVMSEEGFTYSVQRTQCQGAVAVPLVVTGDAGCFDVPASVTLSSGICTATFTSVAGDCKDGSVGISILPPSGFGLETYDSITLQSGSESGAPDSGTATVTLRN